MKKRILAAVLALMMICSLLPMTVLAEESGEGTPVPTETVSPVPTETVSPVPTETVSPVPTETVSPVPTETVSPVPTETVSPVPTETVSPTPVATQKPDKGSLMLAPSPKNGTAPETPSAELYTVVNSEKKTSLSVKVGETISVPLYYGVYGGETTQFTTLMDLDNINGADTLVSVKAEEGLFKISGISEGEASLVSGGTSVKVTVTAADSGNSDIVNGQFFAVVNGAVTTSLSVNVGQELPLNLYYGNPDGEKVALTMDQVSCPDGNGMNEVILAYKEPGSFAIMGRNEGTARICYTNRTETIIGTITVEVKANGGPSGPSGPSGPGPGGPPSNAVVQFPTEAGLIPVTVGIGAIYESMVVGFPFFGDYYTDDTTEGFKQEFVLAALVNEGGTQKVAPKEFYEAITDVKFTLVDTEDENGNAMPDGVVVVDTKAYSYESINTWMATVSAPAQKGFKTTLELSFKLDVPNPSGEPVEYAFVVSGDYHRANDLRIELPKDSFDTAAELNALLASYEALINGLKSFANPPVTEWDNDGRVGQIILELPAVVYDDVITCATEWDGDDVEGMIDAGIILIGTNDGTTQTTMPGLIAKGGLGSVSGIVFEGSNKSGTGIYVQGGQLGYQNDLVEVKNNVFRNLNVGIQSTGGGWAGGIKNNVFDGCKTGLLINCEGDTGDSGNAAFSGNEFNDCVVGVEVVKLPNGVTPYNLRINYNVFVDNATDFKVNGNSQPGTYFFYLNFYGRSNNGNAKPCVIERGGEKKATVVTNPCYTTKGKDVRMIDNTDGLCTWILPGMASQLTVDGGMLKQNSGVTEITLLDSDSENAGAAAVWTFGGNE